MYFTIWGPLLIQQPVLHHPELELTHSGPVNHLKKLFDNILSLNFSGLKKRHEEIWRKKQSPLNPLQYDVLKNLGEKSTNKCETDYSLPYT
jgi:hypothetical protein